MRETIVDKHIGEELPDPSHINTTRNQAQPINKGQALNTNVRVVYEHVNCNVYQN